MMNLKQPNQFNMKTLIMFIMMLFILLPGNLKSQEVTNPINHDEFLIFKIEMLEEVALGKEIPLTISLQSKKNLEVNTLDTATIEYVLDRLSADKQKRIPYGHHLADNTRFVMNHMPNGKELGIWLKEKQKKVSLNAGEKIERSFDMSTIFNRRIGPGNYVLSVIYEDRAKADTTFRVVISKELTVPALINLIEKENFETRVWARNSLFITTGQPEWSPKIQDNAEKVKTECNKLRSWWQKNKSLIELRNGKLIHKKIK